MLQEIQIMILTQSHHPGIGLSGLSSVLSPVNERVVSLCLRIGDSSLTVVSAQQRSPSGCIMLWQYTVFILCKTDQDFVAGWDFLQTSDILVSIWYFESQNAGIWLYYDVASVISYFRVLKVVTHKNLCLKSLRADSDNTYAVTTLWKVRLHSFCYLIIHI